MTATFGEFDRQAEGGPSPSPDAPVVEDDFWGERDGDKSGVAPGGSGDAAAGIDDANAPLGETAGADALDVEATPVAAKRSKVVPLVFAAIFLTALVVTGSALWTGYQKFTGKSEQLSNPSAAGGVIDVGNKAAAGSASAQASGSIPLPGNSSSGTILMQPSAPEPTPSSATTAVAPAAVDPAAVATAIATTTATTNSTATAPRAGEQATVKDKEEQAQAEKVAKAEKAQAEKVAKAEKVARPARPSVGAKAKARVAAESASKAHPARGSRPAMTKARSQTAKDSAEAGKGWLSQYKVMSIWPRAGEFQQAWVKSASSGNVHIVRAGDVLDGMQVLSVDSVANLVRTNQGEIR